MSASIVLLTVSLCCLFRSACSQTTYSNPIIYADFPDNDVTRGPDGAYYFSASSFQYSPGAPILKSYDLVNWEFIGHSVPMLDFGPAYNMTGTPAYVGGIWASTLRYRPSNQKWYWIGCIGFYQTYIYTAPDITGPWELSSKLPGGTCYYDCGLLIDDDDTMYVAYGNTNVSIAQLAADGLSQVKTKQVFSTPAGGPNGGWQGIEGNRLYKINGTYYVLDDSPSGATFIWKADSIWGNWTSKLLEYNEGSPLPGGGTIDQGSLVQAPNDQWYFISCSVDYPEGRIPVMAPITWGSDGFPSIDLVDGGWAPTYDLPGTPHTLSAFTGTDNFTGTSLAPAWEWNFNPDTSKFSVDDGLTMDTATVTYDLYAARNILTHRTYGPSPTGTLQLDFTGMADGDRAGFAVFRDQSSWLEVMRSGDAYDVRLIRNATQDMNNSWKTISNGTVEATESIAKGQVWFRVSMNVMPNSNKQASFSYSTDGESFDTLGTPYTLVTDWQYFLGYRYAVFNYASKALGGSAKVVSFTDE